MSRVQIFAVPTAQVLYPPPSTFNKRDETPDGPPPSSPLSTRGCALIAVNLLFFVTSLFILFITLPLSPPIPNKIKTPLIDTQVQGDLFPSENPPPGRLEPCPATNELCQDFETQRPFVLSREQMLALGKDPDKTVKHLQDEDFCLGNDAYMTGMNVFHVLHSFNSIRKEAFRDYLVGRKTYHMRCRDEHALDIAKAGMVRRPADGGFQKMKISEMYWGLMGNGTMPGDDRHHPSRD
ncbi:hypothetical protein VTN00DRAFT_5836 [Thermoascus crustaceus]|uniref:uncharacterized protein n=1 Tax=Thermoascus crustaceus TaxID=5088 RepID=UPI00374361CE